MGSEFCKKCTNRKICKKCWKHLKSEKQTTSNPSALFWFATFLIAVAVSYVFTVYGVRIPYGEHIELIYQRLAVLEQKAANWTHTIDKYIEAYFQRLRMTQ